MASYGTVPPTTASAAPVGRRRVGGGGNICMYILALLLPPLAVFFETGCGGSFCLNIILTIIGYIPGILHAFYVIMTRSTTGGRGAAVY